MIKLVFKKNQTDFSSQLKRDISEYLKVVGNNKYRNRSLFVATTLLLVIVGIYLSLLFFTKNFTQCLALLTLLAGLLTLSGTSIMHEATHGNLFSSKKINSYFISLFDILMCFSSDQYRLRHLIIHHNYTNVEELDYDLDTNGLIRLSPHFPLKPKHSWQKIYAFLLYPIGILHIAWIEDIKRVFTSKIGIHSHKKWKAKDRLKLFCLKAIHILLFIIWPLQYHSGASVLASYLYVFFLSSMGISLIFQLSHVNTKVSFPVAKKVDENFEIDENWFEHQLKTTANYASESKLILFLTGGVNLQIEHHLFPNLSYWHLPAVRNIVKKRCIEFNIPYYEFSSFGSALKSHVTTLASLGIKK